MTTPPDTCPHCGEDEFTDENDGQFICGTYWNANREIERGNICLERELAAAQADKQRLRDGMEHAWGIIANVAGGDWDRVSPEWRHAAETWRDEYVRAIEENRCREALSGVTPASTP